MLVLTRKQGEQIRIGDDVVITVIRTKGKTVRLGIDAPANVNVLRGELVGKGRIADEEPAAAAGSSSRVAASSQAGAGRVDRPGAEQTWSTRPDHPSRPTHREQAMLDDAIRSQDVPTTSFPEGALASTAVTRYES